METNTKLKVSEDVSRKLFEIVKLYGESKIANLLNDLVAIGTWPTPESPFPDEVRVSVRIGKGSVAIDTVPLPEKTKQLKEILSELIEISRNKTVKDVLK
jgi:hypothetical protein